MKKIFAITALSLAALSAQAKDIVDTAVAAGNFKTLATALQAAGLIDTLKGAGPFTVFAPTDEAFKAVPAATLEGLAKDKEALKGVLTYHVIPGKVTSEMVKTGPVKSLQGENLALSKAGTFVTVESAVVTQPDIDATNGVIHVIDTVLIPPPKKK
jgi:uncharacterized surface protein with fasciclin (FAS1) repeats